MGIRSSGDPERQVKEKKIVCFVHGDLDLDHDLDERKNSP